VVEARAKPLQRTENTAGQVEPSPIYPNRRGVAVAFRVLSGSEVVG